MLLLLLRLRRGRGAGAGRGQGREPDRGQAGNTHACCAGPRAAYDAGPCRAHTAWVTAARIMCGFFGGGGRGRQMAGRCVVGQGSCGDNRSTR